MSFTTWLQLGLGRAAVAVRQFGGRDFRGEILAACLRDDVRDRQTEDHRGPYLLNLIRLCDDDAFFRPAIVQALQEADPSEELFYLAHHLGDGECRQAMREAFARHGLARCGINAAICMVETDGLSGLLLALDSLPGEEDEGLRMAEARHLLRAWNRTKAPSAQHELVAEWRAKVRTYESQWRDRVTPRPPAAPPSPTDELLEHARGQESPRQARKALHALAKRTDPRIRALGLALLAEPGDPNHDMAIDLLTRNGDKRDYPELIRAVLASPADHLHGLGMDYRGFSKAHPSRRRPGPPPPLRTRPLHFLPHRRRQPAAAPLRASPRAARGMRVRRR